MAHFPPHKTHMNTLEPKDNILVKFIYKTIIKKEVTDRYLKKMIICIKGKGMLNNRSLT